MTDTNASNPPRNLRYPIGSKVRSLTNAQGLEPGRCYTVEMTNQIRSFLGTVTTVVAVRDRDEVIYVSNPHLVFRQVGPKLTEEEPLPVEPPRFHKQPYWITVERTYSGHHIFHAVAKNPAGEFATSRRLAAFVYEVAADMERQSERLGVSWAIKVDAEGANIFIMVGANNDSEHVDKFATDVIASLG